MKARILPAGAAALVCAALLAGCGPAAPTAAGPAPSVPGPTKAATVNTPPSAGPVSSSPGSAPTGGTGPAVDGQLGSAGDLLNQLDSQLNGADQAPTDTD